MKEFGDSGEFEATKGRGHGRELSDVGEAREGAGTVPSNRNGRGGLGRSNIESTFTELQSGEFQDSLVTAGPRVAPRYTADSHTRDLLQEGICSRSHRVILLAKSNENSAPKGTIMHFTGFKVRPDTFSATRKT